MTDTRAQPEPGSGTARTRRSRCPARISLFYRQIVAELRKVIWPTRKELITYTTVVIVFVLVVIAFVTVPRLRLQQGGPRGLRLTAARPHRPHRTHADSTRK